MAQPKVYRDAKQCPRCGSSWLPKYGRSRGKQTYCCGQCLYRSFLKPSIPISQSE